MPRYSSRSIGQRFFDQQALHHAAFGTGLMRDQRHAQHLFGDGARFRGILGDLDAAALAASAGVDLRFDDDAAAELLRRRLGFVDGERHFASGHRNAVPGQERLGLIFVDFHCDVISWRISTIHACRSLPFLHRVSQRVTNLYAPTKRIEAMSVLLEGGASEHRDRRVS